MVDETPGVVITIKDIYGEMRELIAEVRNLATEFKAGKVEAEDHEKRLRSLERWMYALPASLLVAVLSAAFTFWKG